MPKADPTPSNAPSPHGGRLGNLLVSASERTRLAETLSTLPVWTVSPRQLCDLELLINGTFSPLDGFLGREDYEEVVERMHLVDGTLWPMPVVLDVTAGFGSTLSRGDRILLRGPDGTDLAILTTSDVWRPNLEIESDRVYGTQDVEHPGVRRLATQTHPIYVGGPIEALAHPTHASFTTLRDDPRVARHSFSRMGWHRVVAVPAHGPMHRAEIEVARRAMAQVEAQLLVHLALGPTDPGEVSALASVRCCQAVLKRFPGANATLSVTALASRMAGPREALWQAIVHQNYGCTHLIVPCHHADPRRANGSGFYKPTAARDLVRQYQDEIAIELVETEDLTYHRRRRVFVPDAELAAPDDGASLSDDEMKERLLRGRALPDWFTYPEVEEILRQSYPPITEQGFTVLLTGTHRTSASPIAPTLVASLAETTGRPVTLLDAADMRQTLSPELGTSPEDQDTHVRRLGFVAAEITKHRGIAVCAGLSPSAKARDWLGRTIRDRGGFVEVFVDTPPEAGDVRAPESVPAEDASQRKGPGNDASHAPPLARIDSRELSVGQAADRVVGVLRREGFLPDRRRPPRGNVAESAPRRAA